MSNTEHRFQVHISKCRLIYSSGIEFPIIVLHPWHASIFHETVIWAHIWDKVAQAAEEDLTAVKDELRSNQMKRWQTVGMLKHVYSFASLPWNLKNHAFKFLLCVTEGNISRNYDDEHFEFSIYMPNLFSALQVCLWHIEFIHIPNLSSYWKGQISMHFISDDQTYIFQAIKMVIIYAPDTVLRKHAFDAFTRVRNFTLLVPWSCDSQEIC